MRIAYITADPGVPVFGTKGCSIHVQEVVRAMAKHDAQVHLFALNCTAGANKAGANQPSSRLALTPSLSLRGGSSDDRASAVSSSFVSESDMRTQFGHSGVSLHSLGCPPKGELALREQRCLAANEVLRAELERQGPFDLVYERYSLWSFAGIEYARATSTPGLVEVNAPLIAEQAEHRGLVDQAGARHVAQRVFGAARALLAVSEEVAQYLQSFPEAQGKVHVVPNGVNPKHFPPKLTASLPAPLGTFTVGFLGTMKPWHGLGELLEAFALLDRRWPESRLLLVGDGAGRQQLADQAASRGLAEAVHFTGAVAPGEVPGLLASMDVAVAPYPKLAHFYFSPLKVYEYMAAGLPVVASRAGQLEKLIETEMTGLLVPPGDVAALADALERLRGDSELRRRLGEAARAKVIRDHTWDRVVERILQIGGVWI